MEKETKNNQQEQAPEEIKIIDGKKYKKVDSGYTMRQYFSHDGPGWDTRYSLLSQYEVDDPSKLPDEPFYSWELVENTGRPQIISENPETIEDAKRYIEGIRSWVGIKANNDSEYNRLSIIIKDLEAGALSPQEAAGQAWELWDKKQDK